MQMHQKYFDSNIDIFKLFKVYWIPSIKCHISRILTFSYQKLKMLNTIIKCVL